MSFVQPQVVTITPQGHGLPQRIGHASIAEISRNVTGCYRCLFGRRREQPAPATQGGRLSKAVPHSILHGPSGLRRYLAPNERSSRVVDKYNEWRKLHTIDVLVP